ncbi:MAG: sulfatase-like hydrolase/transferase, partial [Pseudomonadota bacterium]
MGQPTNTSALFDRLLKASSGAALGSTLGLLLVATLDCAYGSHAGQFVARWLADVGLLAPLALLLAVLLAAVRLYFHGGGRPQPAQFLARQALLSKDDRARANGLLLLAPLAFVFWLIAVSNLATRLLGAGTGAKPAGASMALSALALFWIGAQLLASASDALAKSPRVESARPARALALGLTLAALLMGYAIATGTPSGSGGALAIFGVFKRPELDLRAPGLLALLALAAYAAPHPKRRVAALGVLALAIFMLAFTARSARYGLEGHGVALSIEREAPLGRIALAALRKRSDHDRDGYAQSFAGGDCDDRDPRKNPGAIDIPGNGIDEDCSGSDETAAAAPLAASVHGGLGQDGRKTLSEHHNVVLISIDTLRHDETAASDSVRPITPHLDRLAQDSVVYERAYSLASYTAKSVGPFLLGKYSSETHRDWSHFNRFTSKDVFVAQRLQQGGVHTVSVQGYWYFFLNTGLERGFDVINKSAAPALVTVDGDSNSNGDKVSDAALAELAKPELLQQPFFMWIHYVDPHSEYVPHQGFDFGSSSRQRYDGEVAFVDYHVGRVLDALEKSLVYDHTVVIVTSDHGEAFAEHGMIRHGFELWEELVRVP